MAALNSYLRYVAILQHCMRIRGLSMYRYAAYLHAKCVKTSFQNSHHSVTKKKRWLIFVPFKMHISHFVFLNLKTVIDSWKFFQSLTTAYLVQKH